MHFEQEYGWIESYMLGAGIGTFESVGVTGSFEVEFGLTKTMVSRIIRGETYRHLLPVGTGKAWAPSMGAGSVFAWRPAA